MAIPLIAGAIGTLLRRYGLKKLEGKAAQTLADKASRGATAAVKKTVKGNARNSGLKGKKLRAFVRSADASKAEKATALKAARKKQVTGNIAGDASGAGISYELYSSPNDLEEYVKNNKPRVWARYKKSNYSSLKEYLKDRA